ncbi:MAG: glycosyltransferase family 4 protein [Candidatus Hinthialibacter sp.]
MPRVVVLCRVDGNFGGVERYILSLAHNLNSQRYHPIIVGIGRQGELLRQARKEGFETEYLPMDSRLHAAGAAAHLLAIVKQKNADLAHTFGLRSNCLVWLMRKYVKIPWIVRLPNINSTDYADPLRGAAAHWFNNYLIRRADALQVISPQLENYVRSWRKKPKAIYTIHNGVDVQRYDRRKFDSSPAVDAIRRQFHIEKDAILIGSVGRLDAIKRFDRLVEIFAKIAQERRHAHLMLTGDGPQRAKLLSLSQKHHLEAKIHITGYVEDVRPYVALFDLFVCSSKSEGAPMAMLEAMAMETPVVSTRVGGIESIIQHGHSGLLVRPNDDEALLESVRQILGDREALKVMGRNAREHAATHFSIGRTAEQVQQMYDQVIDQTKLGTL